MPGRGAPSILKRQKEQKRLERAAAKRAARQARKEEKAARKTEGEPELETGPEPETTEGE